MRPVFDAYARYYDLLYRDKDYAGEAGYVASLIERYSPGAKRLLELGCGTGAHAEHLVRKGYSVHGVDKSGSMLDAAAARKAKLANDEAARFTLSHGDVRSVRLDVCYDAVIALFHVMSYQTHNDDLRAAFATAAAHLRPGGLFVFDFWYGPAVLTQKPEVRVKRFADDTIKVTRIAEPVMHPHDNVVEVNYSVFIELLQTGKVEQVQETHRMRHVSLPELSLLRSGLFEELSSHAWMEHGPLTAQSWAGVQVLVRGVGA